MRMNFQNMKQGLCRLRGEEEERGRRSGREREGGEVGGSRF